MQHRVLQRRSAMLADAVRPLAGEQLEEHDAQRIDIGRGSHRLRAELLGRGVVRRHRAADVARQLLVGGGVVCEQLRHAEVEQPHAAARRDEDVARLQVAVHDQPRMRMRHRVGHFDE